MYHLRKFWELTNIIAKSFIQSGYYRELLKLLNSTVFYCASTVLLTVLLEYVTVLLVSMHLVSHFPLCYSYRFSYIRAIVIHCTKNICSSGWLHVYNEPHYENFLKEGHCPLNLLLKEQCVIQWVNQSDIPSKYITESHTLS